MNEENKLLYYNDERFEAGGRLLTVQQLLRPVKSGNEPDTEYMLFLSGSTWPSQQIRHNTCSTKIPLIIAILIVSTVYRVQTSRGASMEIYRRGFAQAHIRVVHTSPLGSENIA